MPRFSKRLNYVSVRVSETEHARLLEAASAKGQTSSELVRSLIASLPVEGERVAITV